jgi:hypothetical protein
MTIRHIAITEALSAINSALEPIETDLCNYLEGVDLDDPGETIASLMDAAATHLRRLMSELRAAGMAGSLSDLPVFEETAEEVDDDPLALPVGKVLDTMQPLLQRLGELRDESPDLASLNSKLLAIDHLAMMTLGRVEKCREIAAV